MGKYSKLFGAGTGVLIGQLLAIFLPPEKAGAIGQIAAVVLPIAGTYFAPANADPNAVAANKP